MRIDTKNSRLFPDRQCCGDGSEYSDYGERGGKPYFRPHGWTRFSLHVSHFDQIKDDWPVAYHGTSSANALSILSLGLQRPGEEGVITAHGQAYSQTKRTIYLSPSIEYAAFPVYASFFETRTNHWAQLVLQCRVNPDAVTKRRASLGRKYWPSHVCFDPNFKSMEELEWLLEDSSDIIVYGLMVREFGPEADASIYGPVAKHVTSGREGPEFEWTRSRAIDFEQRGFLADRNT